MISLLFWAWAFWLAGGVLALMLSRWPLLSSVVGAGSAVAGGVIGSIPALKVLSDGSTEVFQRPWNVPYGSLSIEIDPLSAVFLLPALWVPAVAAVHGARVLWSRRDRLPIGAAWVFFNVLISGMALVVTARNGVLFLFAWEVMTLASYFLLTIDDQSEAVRSAGKTYLIAAHLGAAFLFAFFALQGGRGSLDFHLLDASTLAPAGLLFVLALVGFGTKAGFMPLHVWLPKTYPVIPGFMAAVLSGAMSKMGIYGLVRALSLIPNPPAWWGWTLIGVGALSAVGGILKAMAKDDFKRLLAYSSIENVGVISLGLGIGVLGASSGNKTLALLGYSGALLHVWNHALCKGLLFLGSGVVEESVGTTDLERLGGLSKRMPGASVAVLIGSVAIVGLPPLGSFVSEFLIYRGAFQEEISLGNPWAVPALVVIGTLALVGGLAAVAFSKLFGIAFLGTPRSEEAKESRRMSPLMTLPLFPLAAGTVLIGLFPGKVASYLPAAVVTTARLDATALESATRAELEPLSSLAVASWAFVLIVLGLTAFRAGLLAKRGTGLSCTWGCGYTGGTSRMQYTSASFSQPAVEVFSVVLRPTKSVVPPSGLFPESGSLETATPELTERLLYQPATRFLDRSFARLRWLQSGSLYLYVLYIGATAVALLVWFFGLRN